MNPLVIIRKIYRRISKAIGRLFPYHFEMKTFGIDNPDKKFLVIRRDWTGLFSYVQTNLGWIDYAYRHGYTPVIDMQTQKSPYLKSLDGVTNAWEYYFLQPSPYSLEQVLNSKNVYFTTLQPPKDRFRYKDILKQGIRYKRWAKSYNKYIQLSDAAKKYFNFEYDTILKDKRVLGVSLRGTDYVSKKPKGHPIQPEILEVIKMVEKKLDEWKCDYIYLLTDERKIYQQFADLFGDIVLINKRRFFDDVYVKDQYITDVSFDRENDDYLQGMEYLSSVYLLSQCHSLIAGLHGASYAASLINSNKYEHVHFFFQGQYS